MEKENIIENETQEKIKENPKKEYKKKLKEEKARRKAEAKLKKQELKQKREERSPKKGFMAYRKIIILVLFFVLFPLIAFSIAAITYHTENTSFSVKFSDNNTKKYGIGAFSKYKPGENRLNIFSKFEIKPVRRNAFYEMKSDVDDKLNPIGYGFRVDITLAVNKNIEWLLWDGGEGAPELPVKAYVGTVLPKSKKVPEFTTKNFTKATTSSQYFTVNVDEKLPYRVAFAPDVKSAMAYIIIRIPNKKQPRIDIWKAKNNNRVPDIYTLERENLIDYYELLYYVNMDEAIGKDKFTHTAWNDRVNYG